MAREEEVYGGTEVPRGMDVDDFRLIVRQEMRELRAEMPQPKVVVNGNGYKLAFILLGILVSVCIGLSGWALVGIVDLKVQMAVVTQCVTDRSTCDHHTYRGAANDE